MAGIVHEVENADLLARVRQESANAARQLAEAARLHRGQIVVVGCSTSEVVGRRVGAAGPRRRWGRLSSTGCTVCSGPWACTLPPSAASI